MATNRIKEFRESRGMTLEELAEKVGLSASYVQRLENGERNLAVKHFDAFASALGVHGRDLIGDDASESTTVRVVGKHRIAGAVTQPDFANLELELRA